MVGAGGLGSGVGVRGVRHGVVLTNRQLCAWDNRHSVLLDFISEKESIDCNWCNKFDEQKLHLWVKVNSCRISYCPNAISQFLYGN